MLSATLTRPTTISPTTTHDTKVYLVETIDIAPILEPKPRVISLEPIFRRSRARSNAKKRTTPADSPQQSVDGAEASRNGRVPELSSVTEESHTPGSPAPSDVSFDSQFSNMTGSGVDSGRLSVSTGDSGGTLNGSKISLKDKTITATIELLKAGFLRGDNIPVKILVNHTKHIKSFHGIIVTLYRQARVDMHPALPVAPNSKADKASSEDYYPKSRTGLGGLSLSSAGSSHVFRKDLAQSFAPLFVDPRTFTAEVKASVRVPEGAFPTISSVPGAMISFKYYVEVVVDLQGKLAGLDKLFPSSGLVSVPTALGTTPAASRFEDPVRGIVSAWGGNFIDTESIRRDKSVVTCVFEVVIGTKDSDRKGKRKQEPELEPELEPEMQQGVHQIELAPGDPRYYPSAAEREYYGYDYQDQYYGQYGYGEQYQEGYQGEHPEGYYPENAYQNRGYPTAEPLPHPPEPESQLSEKERLRQAEARLLPSQPPTTQDSSCEATTAAATAPQVLPPSAPDLPDDESLTYHAAAPPHQLPYTDDDTRTIVRPSTPSFLPVPHTTSSSTITALDHPSRATRSPPPLPSASAPSYTPHAGLSSSSHPAPLLPPTDDKQELQRRRLELERSAPEDVPDGEGEESGGAVGRPAAAVLAPSAPVLDEDEDDDDALLGRGAGAGVRMELPRYER